MKTTCLFKPHSFLAATIVAAVATLLLCTAPSALAAGPYYWDCNDGAAGFGTAQGTIVSSTIPSATQGWSTNATGETQISGGVGVIVGTAGVATFGTDTVGLGAGTINVSGNANVGNFFFGAASGAIVLNGGTMNAGNVVAITVNNSLATINSVLSGSSTSRTVGGSGTLVLNGLNTFTGKLIIGNDTASTLKVQFNTIDNVGAATGSSLGKPATFANGLIQIGSGANGSTLEFANATAAGSTDRQVQVGSGSGVGGATILNNNADPAYSLTFTTNAFNVAVSTSSARNLTLGGDNTGNNQIQGQIINNTGGGNLSLVKSGNGNWSLLGINTLTGTVLISAGTLEFGGANGSVNSNTGITNNGILKVSRTNAPTQGNPSNIGMFNRQPIQGTGSLVEDGSSTGSLTLTTNNTFTGTTKVVSGTLILATNLAIQNSAFDTANSVVGDADNGLKITNSTTLTLGGLTGNKDFASVFTTTTSGYSGLTALTLNPNSGSVSYSGVIADGTAGMALTKTGAGTQTLNGANSYTGNTTISAGSLALGAAGSISNTPLISIAAGSTLDVSAIASFALSASTTLSASGTATPATISGNAGADSVNLGSRPVTLAYNGANPALTIAQGQLVLNVNQFTVNGSVLADGAYNIVSQTSGSINATGPFPAATGTALTGKFGTISVSGGNVVLTVTTPVSFGKLVVTAVPGSATAGTSFSVTVEARDSGGITPIAVTADTGISLAASGLGTLSGNTATILAGQTNVTLTGVQYTKAESITLIASRTSGDQLDSSAASSLFNVAAGAASQLVFTTQPSANNTNSVAFATQPVVQLKDALNNVCTSGVDVTATVYLSLTTGSGILGGTTSMAAVLGVADFVGQGLNIDAFGNDKVLTATVTNAASAVITTTSSPAFSIARDPSLLPLLWATDVAGDWDLSTANWKDTAAATVTFFTGDSVRFDDTYITANTTVTVPGTVTAASVTVTNATYDYTISGSGSIAGTNALTKSGVAKLTLTGTNTYSGGTTLAGGQLNINFGGSSSANSAIGTGTLAISPGTNGCTIDNTSGGPVTLLPNNPITINPNTFAFGGSQDLNLGTGAVTFTLPANSTTRIITLSNAPGRTLTFGGAVTASNRAGDQTNQVDGAGNTLVFGSYALNGNAQARNNVWSGSANVTVNGGISTGGNAGNKFLYVGSGTFTICGASTYGGATTIGSGSTLQLGDGTSGRDGTIASTSVVNSGTLIFNCFGSSSYGGVVSGSGSVTKAGPGTQTLTGTNTYTGNTTVSNGTLVIQVASIATNSTVSVAAGAQLQLNFAGGETNIVAAFYTNGVSLPNGVYKAANVGPFVAGTGSLQVGSGSAPPTPAQLTNSISGSTLTLTWPSGQGWTLKSQTNSLSSGLNPNLSAWGTVSGGIDGSNSITINPANPTVFYRLFGTP